MDDLAEITQYLRNYDGPLLRFMEVCGTHTAEISHNGIRSLLSPKIELISGPGCPVCVTVTAYIDRLLALAREPDCTVVTFGDMLRVPGSAGSLSDAKSGGAKVLLVYSPMEVVELAQRNPERSYVFAAVGFETTAPLYALLLQEVSRQNLTNIKLLTSLKTMPSAIDTICQMQPNIDGFLAPGHVSVITGSQIYAPLARRYGLPFVVAGFEGESILLAIYALVRLAGHSAVKNLYPSAVCERGNEEAQVLVDRYFHTVDAAWRGLGMIPGSGKELRREYACYDAGSQGLLDDQAANKACRCASVLIGQIHPTDCPLFGKGCTPNTPQGACMVSMEGSCFHAYTEGCQSSNSRGRERM